MRASSSLSRPLKFLMVVALFFGLLALVPNAQAQVTAGGSCEFFTLTEVCLDKVASPNPVNVGEPLTFTIVFTNSRFLPPLTVLVEDVLPASVNFVSASAEQSVTPCTVPAVGETDGTVSCSILVPTGGTGTVAITVIPMQCGTFTNTAISTIIPVSRLTPVNTASTDFTVNCPGESATPAPPTPAPPTPAEQLPTCPPASQGLAERSTTGNVADTFTAGGVGDNSNQTAAPLQFGNSGPQQNAQGVLQECGSQSGDIGLQGGSMNFGPTLDAPSNQEVGQSSGASGQ